MLSSIERAVASCSRSACPSKAGGITSRERSIPTAVRFLKLRKASVLTAYCFGVFSGAIAGSSQSGPCNRPRFWTRSMISALVKPVVGVRNVAPLVAAMSSSTVIERQERSSTAAQ